MNTNHVIGIWNILRGHPVVLPAVGRNLSQRLHHPLAKNHDGGWSAPPELITVVVTDVCNLHCKMCQYAFSDAPGYQLNQVGRMPSELFRRLVDQIPGQPVIAFTGGEPLLHPEVADFVAYAKRAHRFCTLTTNGWMLEAHARELCTAGLDFLSVSLDGPPELHNHVRGAKAFDRLAAGLQAIMAQPRRPITFLSMAISDLNYDQMLTVFELAREWRLDGINFNHLWMQTDKMAQQHNAEFSIFAADEVAWDIHPERVVVGQVAQAMETIRARTRFSSLIVTQTPDLSRGDIAMWYREPERFVKYRSTRCAWTRLKVWPDGAVKPCRDWRVGNMLEDAPMQVWNNGNYRQFRQLLAANGTLPICARCCWMAYR